MKDMARQSVQPQLQSHGLLTQTLAMLELLSHLATLNLLMSPKWDTLAKTRTKTGTQCPEAKSATVDIIVLKDTISNLSKPKMLLMPMAGFILEISANLPYRVP